VYDDDDHDGVSAWEIDQGFPAENVCARMDIVLRKNKRKTNESSARAGAIYVS